MVVCLAEVSRVRNVSDLSKTVNELESVSDN